MKRVGPLLLLLVLLLLTACNAQVAAPKPQPAPAPYVQPPLVIGAKQTLTYFAAAPWHYAAAAPMAILDPSGYVYAPYTTNTAAPWQKLMGQMPQYMAYDAANHLLYSMNDYPQNGAGIGRPMPIYVADLSTRKLVSNATGTAPFKDYEEGNGTYFYINSLVFDPVTKELYVGYGDSAGGNEGGIMIYNADPTSPDYGKGLGIYSWSGETASGAKSPITGPDRPVDMTVMPAGWNGGFRLVAISSYDSDCTVWAFDPANGQSELLLNQEPPTHMPCSGVTYDPHNRLFYLGPVSLVDYGGNASQIAVYRFDSTGHKLVSAPLPLLPGGVHPFDFYYARQGGANEIRYDSADNLIYTSSWGELMSWTPSGAAVKTLISWTPTAVIIAPKRWPNSWGVLNFVLLPPS